MSLPKPYYQDDYVTLYNADCRDLLPELGTFDLLLTDPPYEKEAHTVNGRTRSVIEGRKAADIIPFAQMDEELRRLVCSVDANWHVIFCQVEAVFKYSQIYGEKYRRAMTWIKPDSAPQFTGDRPAMGHESMVCAWASGGKSRWNSGGKRGVYIHNCTSSRVSDHPTEKPLKLITELIADFSLGGKIVDPFAGSGTTGRAAKDLQRKCVLIEREERYCEVAANRMSQEVLAL